MLLSGLHDQKRLLLLHPPRPEHMEYMLPAVPDPLPYPVRDCLLPQGTFVLFLSLWP